MKTVKVSVVIPVYNVEMYLDRCVESVINQTYENLEIILVDDGSLDRCPMICDGWKEKDKRIIVVHKKNGGLSDARNNGIDIATGDYIAFVDSDDFIELNMIERMINAIIINDADIATCGRFIYDGEIKSRPQSFQESKLLSGEEAIANLFRGKLIEEAAWDKLYKKELFNDIRFPTGEINEDLPIMPYIFKRTDKVICTGVPLYYYCVNPNSITHTNYTSKNSVVIKHLNDLKSNFLNNYPIFEKDFIYLLGRYCYGMLLYFVFDKKLIDNYPDDYSYYKKGLNSAFNELMVSDEIEIKTKIKMLLVRFDLYCVVKLIKKFNG